jgi:Ca-activated chloride channel family protein
MMAALKLALEEPAPESRLGQIVFLTDGSVGNEAQLFAYIKAHLGATRLFTVGIGSAPNSYFMRKAAEYGRGTHTYIGRVDEVAEKMTALYRKIEEPVVTDIALAVEGAGEAEIWPLVLPDLYRGEPVVASIRLPGADAERGTIELTGLHAGKRWSVSLPLAEARPAKGVGALWARSKIGALSDRLHEGADRETIKRQVVEIALAHHLVSAYTSLVAVDVTPSRPAGSDLSTRDVPLNLPDGWNFDKVFGERPMPAAAPLRLRKADATIDAAARPQLAEARGASGATLSTLPQGATPASVKLLAGVLSLLLAVALLWWHRRQTRVPR